MSEDEDDDDDDEREIEICNAIADTAKKSQRTSTFVDYSIHKYFWKFLCAVSSIDIHCLSFLSNGSSEGTFQS